MKNKDLKIKIDNQIKKLIDKIDSNDSREEIKETQIILNDLLENYFEEWYEWNNFLSKCKICRKILIAFIKIIEYNINMGEIYFINLAFYICDVHQFNSKTNYQKFCSLIIWISKKK